MDFDNVTASEITFKEELKASDESVVFLVEVRGQTCVIKVVCGSPLSS